MRLLVSLLSFTVAGCGFAPIDELRLSADLTDAEVAMAIDAADDWCRASRDTCLQVTSTSARDSDANVFAVDQRRPHWGSDWHGVVELGTWSSYIEVLRSDLGIMGASLRHELGHALRRDDHHSDERSLMSHPQRFVTCIPERDAEWVCDRVGCSEWRGTCD